jgi:hypothetical protein
MRATIESRPMLSMIYGWCTKARCRWRTGRQAVGRSSLKNLADPCVRRLLNRVKQPVAFDGHIEFWADGFSFANAFSHPHVQLRNMKGRPAGTVGGTIGLFDRTVAGKCRIFEVAQDPHSDS